MSGKSSRKGSKAERTAAKMLQAWTGDSSIWRNKGQHGTADIVLWNRLHVEVKDDRMLSLLDLLLCPLVPTHKAGKLTRSLWKEWQTYTDLYGSRPWLMLFNQFRVGWFVLAGPTVMRSVNWNFGSGFAVEMTFLDRQPSLVTIWTAKEFFNTVSPEALKEALDGLPKGGNTHVSPQGQKVEGPETRDGGGR